MVFISFIGFRVRVSDLVIMKYCTVDGSRYIAVAWFIVFVCGRLLIFFVFLISRLLNARWVRRFALLVYFFRCALRLQNLGYFIACSYCFICFGLFFLVSVCIGSRLVLVKCVIFLEGSGLYVFRAFVVGVAFSRYFDAIRWI